MQLLDRHAIQNRLPLEESGCVFGRANSESKQKSPVLRAFTERMWKEIMKLFSYLTRVYT